MIKEHFYVKSDIEKMSYTKLTYEEVIMIFYHNHRCNIYTISGAHIKVQMSLVDCFMRFFKSQGQFIRSSEDYIININHIIGADHPKRYAMTIYMANNNMAQMRTTHLYAKKILASNRKTAIIFQSAPKGTQDSTRKDEIILEYPDAMVARNKIREELSERVTVGYVRKRLKELSKYEV